MNTSFAASSDGCRIAYDITGSGPAIVLLHGGAQSRKIWHSLGYVSRLLADYTVLTVDLRGHGESDKPTDARAYTTMQQCKDILAAVDQAGIEQFMLWGYSFGANIGRYLAAQSERVRRFVLVGIPFGAGASGEFHSTIVGVRDRWIPILKAQQDGSLDEASLSPAERSYLQSGRAGSEVAWLTAILDWEHIGPNDLLCSTLWILGGENRVALENARSIEATLAASHVCLTVIDGLTHETELTEVDSVLPYIQQFLERR
ncbi:alpha/beta hydrolase [Dyella tabacisoli]|uniref:Alpha/beta hydrolase n=1 Tax=Dyella tabacisoli TaxID=2282381 RepID=A0A369UIG0_9GAMM|nr:alpha/beta hydrolase [Dyella tabacisoli]RDD80133.1 alpha/beta hydrolase [Dyella tabacisoli]